MGEMEGRLTSTGKVRRQAAWALAIAAVASSVLAHAQDLEHPKSLGSGGYSPVVLLGQATRTLVGGEALYTIALYEDAAFDRRQLSSPEVAKALRIAVEYTHDWRRPPLINWQQELVPRLLSAPIANLRLAFASLQRGDIVLIEYAPRKGTSVHINRSIAVLGEAHELMLAFLDHWLGQRPVSEDLRRNLLGGP